MMAPSQRRPSSALILTKVAQWCTSIVDQPPQTGWGGRCADLLAAVQPNAPISLSVSVAGNNLFQVGNLVPQFCVGPLAANRQLGARPAHPGGDQHAEPLTYPNMQARAYAKVAQQAFSAGGVLSNAILPTADSILDGAFP